MACLACFPSLVNLLHGGSLCQGMVAFVAQDGVFSWGLIWRPWGVLSLSVHVLPVLKM